MADLILASASPRRQELLKQIGVHFVCLPMNIDESPLKNEGPHAFVTRLAEEKTLAALPQAKGLAVLGSDTIVTIDNQILGKPKNSTDAKKILSLLSARTNVVMTGVSICQVINGQTKMLTKVVSTEVKFLPLSQKQIAAYVKTGEPMDKAGAYGIQGLAAVFIESINGCYSNVVGLPLAQTGQLLEQFNVPVWQPNSN